MPALIDTPLRVAYKMASVNGETETTKDNSAGIAYNIPVTGVDAAAHTWSFQIDGITFLSMTGTGNGAGGLTDAKQTILSGNFISTQGIANSQLSSNLIVGNILSPLLGTSDQIVGAIFVQPGIANGIGNVTEVDGLSFISLAPVSLGDQVANTSVLSNANFASVTYVSTGTRTITTSVATLLVSGPPIAGAGVVFSAPAYTAKFIGDVNFSGRIIAQETNGNIPFCFVNDLTTGLTGGAGVIGVWSAGVSVFNISSVSSVSQIQYVTAFRLRDGVSATLSMDGGQNLLISTAVAGSSARKTIVLTNSAVDPTTSVDAAHLYARDISAGNATLALFTETAVAVDAALVSDHSLTIFINSTKYKIPLIAA